MAKSRSKKYKKFKNCPSGKKAYICCKKYKPCKSGKRRNIYGKCVPINPRINWKKLTDSQKQKKLSQYDEAIEAVVNPT